MPGRAAIRIGLRLGAAPEGEPRNFVRLSESRHCVDPQDHDRVPSGVIGSSSAGEGQRRPASASDCQRLMEGGRDLRLQIAEQARLAIGAALGAHVALLMRCMRTAMVRFFWHLACLMDCHQSVKLESSANICKR